MKTRIQGVSLEAVLLGVRERGLVPNPRHQTLALMNNVNTVKRENEYAVNMWTRRYPNEPFENEVKDDSEIYKTVDRKDGTDLDVFLTREVTKFKDLYERFFASPYMGKIVYLIPGERRYKKMLQLVQQSSDDSYGGGGCSVFVPTVDVLLMWLTHQA